MRGIRHHADVDAVLVVGLEEVLEHHRAAALAPLRPVLAVQGAEIVGCFFRSIDVRMPVDDHACVSVIEITTRERSSRRERGNSRSAFSRLMAVMSAAASSNLLRAAAITVVDPNGASDP